MPHKSSHAGHVSGQTPGIAHGSEPHSLDPRQVMATRELFWQNVIREILTSLSMMCALRPAPRATATAADHLELPGQLAEEGAAQEAADEPAAEEQATSNAAEAEREVSPASPLPLPPSAETTSFDAQLFDGRLAVMTRRGDRIPIADVFPLFACGIDTPRDRILSLALECTVFQIRTPAGEVYTLPLHEIASFQALTPDLMRRLSQMARKRQEDESGQKGVQQPFGFAAFTSISRETPPPMTESPEGPGEDAPSRPEGA